MVAAILKLIRWPNLLMIVFIQYLIRYGLILPLNLPHLLNDWYFSLGVLCTLLLAAGGYIINDIYDQGVDGLNKPHRVTIGKVISEQRAWNLYLGTIIASAAGTYALSLEAGLDNIWLIAPLASLLLYLYATDLKKWPLIGNIIVSVLAAMPIFLIAIFDILPVAGEENAEQVKQSFEVIMAYAGFAFWTTLIREMLKDAEDIKGDAQHGYRTLAVRLNSAAFKTIVAVLLIIMIVALAYYLQSIWIYDRSSSFYVLLAVIGPSIYVLVKLFAAQKSSDYRALSFAMKVLMLLGILSIPFFTLSLLYQWP